MAKKELTQSEVLVKGYLDEYAKQDKAFAEKYANPDKTFDDCIKYIKQEARKQAANGCAMVTKEEVYGWAVHFYDEDDIKVDCNVSATMVAAPQDDQLDKAEEKPKKKREARQAKQSKAEVSDPDIPAPLEIPLL